MGESGISFLPAALRRILFDIGHGEERAPRMDPTRRFLDRSRVASRQIELVVPVIGVGLQWPLPMEVTTCRTAFDLNWSIYLINLG